ncbi:MAG: hypothetical protein GY758_20550 [Fuerstiella sp.]|nr:hypothetical protein [Fuerstiella sp.]MCP4508367.1 hypothetical protein [Fuerstiella sp.]
MSWNGADSQRFSTDAWEAYEVSLTAWQTGVQIQPSASGVKVGLFGATPVTRPTTGHAAATFAANTSGISDDSATFDGYTIGQVIQALRDVGVLS